MEATVEPRLGLRANAGQFALLLGVNGLVGALVGQERTLVPLLGATVFGVRSATAAVAFVVAFGTAKALTNLATGALANRVGRRRLLLVGWLVGLPVPFVLIWAPSWTWVILANVLLGVNQGLAWSMTVIMKIDLAGPERRGLATGLNESAGYGAVAVSAWVSGLLAARFGLRPEPFFLGVAAAALGLGLSFLVRDTEAHVRLESAGGERLAFREVLARATFRDPALAAASRTGLANNATDAVAWGLLPVLFLRGGLDAPRIGLLAGLYTGVWGVGQLATGPLSDRIGRRLPIAAGMWVQAGSLAVFALAHGLALWSVAAVAFGLGTALAYPALLAAVGDLAEPAWRAEALGAYRLFRDGGYVAGGLIVAAATEVFHLGIGATVWAVAVVAAVSGIDAWRHLSVLDGRKVVVGAGS